MFNSSSVFALINNEGKDEVKLVDVDSDTQQKICSTLFAAVGTLEERQPVEFDGRYKPDCDELLDIESFAISELITNAISDPISIAQLSYSVDDEPDIKAIFVGDYQRINNSEVITVAFQRFRKEQYISTKKINLFYDRDTFAVEKRWGIGISENVDCIYKDGHLQFESYYFARQIFDLSEYYRTATASEVKEFSSLDMLNIIDKQTFIDNADSLIRRKIALINDSGIFDNYDVQTIKRIADGLGLELLISDGKITIPTSKRELKKLLAFLDEEVFKGPFSEQTFMANSKKKVGNL